MVVFNPANGKAPVHGYTGFYNKGTDVTLAQWQSSPVIPRPTSGPSASTQTGTYTFSTAEGKKLSMDEKYSSTPWIRPTPAGASFPPPRKIASISRTPHAATIWSGTPIKSNWSSYGSIGNEALFARQFYLVVDDGGSDEPSGDLPSPATSS